MRTYLATHEPCSRETMNSCQRHHPWCHLLCTLDKGCPTPSPPLLQGSSRAATEQSGSTRLAFTLLTRPKPTTAGLPATVQPATHLPWLWRRMLPCSEAQTRVVATGLVLLVFARPQHPRRRPLPRPQHTRPSRRLKTHRAQAPQTGSGTRSSGAAATSVLAPAKCVPVPGGRCTQSRRICV